MKFWNDELRICPKCKTAVALKDEPQARCPECRSVVWFFNYEEAHRPPEVPEPPSDNLWKNPTTHCYWPLLVCSD
jgi:hypothetical protein